MSKASASMVALAVFLTAAVVSGAFVYTGGLLGPKAPLYNQSSFYSESPTGELRKLSGNEEIQAFFALKASGTSYATTALAGGRSLSSEASDFAGAVPSAKESDGGYSSDYSSTNVQYASVDEADIVKNDGRYIYAVSGGLIAIIDTNGGELKEASTIPISEPGENYWETENPREIFVKGDRLFAIADTSERGFYFQKYDIRPQEYSRSMTKVLVYDISDRENPTLVSNSTVSGSYSQSRLIGNYVFIVANEYPRYGQVYPPILFAKAERITPDVYYFDNPEENHQFSTVASFDIESGSLGEAKSFLIGYANTLMVSEENIYIAYQKSQPCGFWRPWGCAYSSGYDRGRFTEVVVPLLSGELKANVESIISQGLPEEEEWEKISEELGAFFKRASEDSDFASENDEIFARIEDALQEYDLKRQMENHGTVIHRISISKDSGKIEYGAKGEVFGSLLNQFSLDESDGKLRVATTFSAWLDRGSVQFNNVYLLERTGMQVTGKLENISSGESIYSTRFIGNRLYMVTFRQTDPLFAIDLSGENPTILGELKIPGFSTYLHPYKENYLVGMGRETKENENGGATIQGLKLSLFDVSDVANPRQVGKFEIGTRESDSAALYEHKAFLLSESKGIVSIPVSETTQVEILEPSPSEKRPYYYPEYKYRIWTGAYVLGISESGFELLGTVEHSSFENSYFYWQSPSTVTRSLYIGDNLYTISEEYVKANRLSDLSSVGSYSFPENNDVSYYKYYSDASSPEMMEELTCEEAGSC